MNLAKFAIDRPGPVLLPTEGGRWTKTGTEDHFGPPPLRNGPGQCRPRLAHLYDPGCKVLVDRISERSNSESSGPLRREMPEVVAASGSTGTILPKWPHFSLPPTGPDVHFACRLPPSGEISRLHSAGTLKQTPVQCGKVPLSRWAELGERSGPRRSSELTPEPGARNLAIECVNYGFLMC